MLNKDLEQAFREASNFKDEYVSTEHLLLGVAHVKNDAAREALVALGATHEAMEQSGLKVTAENAERVGVFIGSGIGGFDVIEREHLNLLHGGPRRISPFFIPAAIVNLLGDVWLNGTPDFPAALAVPGVRLHLYEKHTPRAGRKMGHLSATGATAEEALERVLEAKRRL